MNFIEIIPRSNVEENSNLALAILQFEKLIDELKGRKLNDEVVSAINKNIEEINNSKVTNKDLKNHIRKIQTEVIKLIEKEVNLVTKNHHRNTWLAIGMAAIGIPLGVVFGTIFGNMAFIGIGLPIGLAIGIAVGTNLDNKALKEGRQLDLELKY